MPPRKKAKASAASTPADVQPKTPQDTGATGEHDLLNDAWGDEQETQLFKSMIKWKPTGMHKHFRMISIHADMRSHGFAADDAPHTRIPGIWNKVASLYDLRALDEREDAYAFSEDSNPADPEEAATIPDFELPEDEFGELIWQRRFHGPESDSSSSPPVIPIEDDKLLYVPDIGMLKDLPDGIRSQQAESVVEATPTPTPKKAKNTRAYRGTAKSGKAGKGQAAKNTKAQSAVSESAAEEDDDEDEEESSVESEEETAPTTRRAARSKGKAQPAPKRTRKR